MLFKLLMQHAFVKTNHCLVGLELHWILIFLTNYFLSPRCSNLTVRTYKNTVAGCIKADNVAVLREILECAARTI